MGCKIALDISKNVDDLYNLAVNELKTFNGNSSGDQNGGTFKFKALGGTFSGSYSVVNNSLILELTEKPFLVPCLAVETFLRSYLN